jgi:hypothetical protein
MRRPAVTRIDGDRSGVRAAAVRISQVLAELDYPAAKWEVLAEADHYGADMASRAQLWALPAGTYPDLTSVLVGLGLVGAPPPGPRGGLPRPRR